MLINIFIKEKMRELIRLIGRHIYGVVDRIDRKGPLTASSVYTNITGTAAGDGVASRLGWSVDIERRRTGPRKVSTVERQKMQRDYLYRWQNSGRGRLGENWGRGRGLPRPQPRTAPDRRWNSAPKTTWASGRPLE